MRLLLDEMIGAVVAEQLRDRGHDVVAVQDPDRGHLRGLDDCLLLATGDDEGRAVVTDNISEVVGLPAECFGDRGQRSCGSLAVRELPQRRQ